MAGFEDILVFSQHPDVETLREFEHPSAPVQRWRGVLSAKAWLGTDLACFFTGLEGEGHRIVILFRPSNAYAPTDGGHDMRFANIGAAYDLDVFATEHMLPIVERAESV